MARYGKGYDNVDDAAAAALMWLAHQPRNSNQEYMGLLFQDPTDQKYYRTEFQTEGKHDTSSYTGAPDGRIAGIVHNHPPQRAGDHYPSTDFSFTDAATAEANKVPSYIVGLGVSGDADRKFVPKGDLTPGQIKTLAQRLGGEHGQPFLAQFPIEEFKIFLMRKLLDRAPNDPRGLML